MEKKETVRVSKKMTMGMATTILILVSFVIVLGGYVYLTVADGYTVDELIKNIVDNLIGVLAAFMLFDIIYNKLTQDAYAQEVSEQITKTLMGDPDTLNVFEESDKVKFIESSINSIIEDEDAQEMLLNKVKFNIEQAKFSRIRPKFEYFVNLMNEFPENTIGFPGVDEGAYVHVQEKISFDVKFLSGSDQKYKSQRVSIGFVFEKRSLDNGLLENSSVEAGANFGACLFNENLDITPEAVSFLKSKKDNKKELLDVINLVFCPSVRIDGSMGEVADVEIYKDGMVVFFDVNYDVSLATHSVRVVFQMPKLADSIFEITLVDPTKAPRISLDYMPETMDVTMYSYLNKANEANDGAYEQNNGFYDIEIKNEWIYPKSGVIFRLQKKNK